MAIFGNFKGTTQSDFKIGKKGPTLFTSASDGSTGAPATALQGDFWIDPSNYTLNVYAPDSNSVVDWRSVGSYLSDLNVDNGTLFVDSSNDTVSIGSISSNEKLFVNGSIRLGTNPSLKYSGAYLDLKHANGTGTVIRVRDNTGATDPIFKVYNANNDSEVFKVDGSNIVLTTETTLYTRGQHDGSITAGLPGQVLSVDGNSRVTWSTNYYYGNCVDSGIFAIIGPLDDTKLRPGDILYYIDENGEGKLYMWVTADGTESWWLDFLPPNPTAADQV